MARPRNTDLNDVLDKALLAFWAHGWEGTSIDALCTATGASRYSLYQTWGDKRGLFEACIDRYLETIADPLLADLDSGGVAAIRGYFDHLVELVSGPQGTLSCFVLNSVVELGPQDEALFARLRHVLDRVRSRLLGALQVAVERGELPPAFPAETHADHLAISVQALLLQGRARPGRPALASFARFTLATLEPS